MLLVACASPDVRLARTDSAGDTAVTETIAGTTPEETDPTVAVFDPDRVHVIALEMDATSWLDVRDNPWAETWHVADFRFGDERVETIGIRAFGQGSEIAGKPSLKLSFDKWVEGQEWRDLDELKLDNSSQDVGFLNERLATAILRRFGVPAARTGWARVEVNGEPAGFFVILESIDDRFVERWFGHDDGVLYGMNSGYWGQGLNPMQDGLTWYEPQTSVDGDGTDLVALAEVVAGGSDAELAAALDLTAFARESVARSAMGSMDAFSADGNNFYLYDDHGVWHPVPWDFDVDLGGYYFSTALTVDASQPWATSPWSYNAVTGADYEDPVLKRNLALGLDVDALIAELTEGAMAWETVDAEAAAAAALIRDDVYADVLGYGPSFDQRAADVRLWLHARLSALTGGEVADCPRPADALAVGELGPAGTVGWGELLVDETYWGPGFNVAGEHACTGLFAHAPSRVTVTVPEGYARLTGAAGLQDWNQQCGDGATFAIEQAGETLWRSDGVANYDAAVPFDVQVSQGTLTLVADPAAEYSCDTAAWVDVWLSR
ncbi:MAG: CotH kinase family protein [Myxococcota bacterium]